jgi:hypothetical protein
MSIKWREYDPYTGVTSINVTSDDDETVTVRREQDVQPILDMTAEARNTNAADIGIKKDIWFYCTIPVTVQYEMLNKGINIFNKDHTAKVLEEINANYPKLKLTNKTHSLTPKRNATSLSKPQDSANEGNSTQPGPSLIVR